MSSAERHGGRTASNAARKYGNLPPEEHRVVEQADKALKSLEKRVMDMAESVTAKGASSVTGADLATLDRDIRVVRDQSQSKDSDGWRAVQGRADHMLGYLDQLRTYLVEMGVITRDEGSGAPEGVPEKVNLDRKMSKLSLDAIDELEAVMGALNECAADIAAAEAKITAKEPGARNQLAQTEAKLNKLEGRNDAVITAHLHAGQQDAKDARKKNLRKMEELFQKIEDLFKLCPAG